MKHRTHPHAPAARPAAVTPAGAAAPVRAETKPVVPTPAVQGVASPVARGAAGVRDYSKGTLRISKSLAEAMDQEKNIVYEKGPFYAFRVKTGIEIRKNGATHATLIGSVKDPESAIRFIDRASRYPDNF